MRQNSYTTKAFILSVIMTGVLLFGATAHAQGLPVIDAANLGSSTSINIFRTIKENLKDVLKKVGATVYKQAVGSLLNTIAADLAKSIATGDFGSPVFTFDKNYYQNLADGVVGDTINDIVNGLTGIDLCNFNPQLTLDLALQLPFYEGYYDNYQPRCSLTQIAENAKNINLRELVKINVDVKTKTVGSWKEFANAVVSRRSLSITAQAVNEMIKWYGDENSKGREVVKADIDVMSEWQKNPKILESVTPEETTKYREDFQKNKNEFLCQLLRNIEEMNFGLVGKGDQLRKSASKTGGDLAQSYDDYDLSACEGDLSFLWSKGNGAGDTFEKSILDSDVISDDTFNANGSFVGALNTVVLAMDAKSKDKAIIHDVAMSRYQALYDMCSFGLENLLKTPRISTTIERRDGETLATVSAGLTNSIRDDADASIVATYPTQGTFKSVNINTPSVINPNSNALILGSDAQLLVYVPANKNYAVHIRGPVNEQITCANALTTNQPTADDLSVTLAGTSQPGIQNVVVANSLRTTSTDSRYSYLICEPTGSAQSPTLTEVARGVVKYTINSNYVVPQGGVAALTKVGDQYIETIKANSERGSGYLTYSQSSDVISDTSFIACQMLFNMNQILAPYYTQNSLSLTDPRFGPQLFTGSTSAIETAYTGEGVNLGRFADLFHPGYVANESHEWYSTTNNSFQDTTIDTPGEYLQAFIRYTIELDFQEAGAGQKLRQQILDEYHTNQKQFLAATSLLKKEATIAIETYTSALAVLDGYSGTDAASFDERLAEWEKELTPEGNQRNTQFKLADSILNAKSKEYEKLTQYANEKGTLLNPDTSAVSEQAKNTPDVKKAQVQAAVSGDNAFREYTGEILTDAATVFLGTLWNQALIRGLSALNPALQNSKVGNFINVNLDPALQQGIAEQEACRKDPSQCTTAASTFLYDPNNPPCASDEIGVIQAFSSLGVTIKNNFKTGCASGKASGETGLCIPENLSSKCEAAVNQYQKQAIAQGTSTDLAGLAEALGGIGEFIRNILGGVGSDSNYSTLQANLAPTLAPAEVNRPETSGRVEFTSVFDTDPFVDLPQLQISDFNILEEMMTCPTDDRAVKTLYNCTLKSSMQNAISETLTISEAINKRYLANNLVVGITADGKVPNPETGFSLAAAQKLRKLRIMPLGFEYAARLKVACYQHKLKEDFEELPGNFPYRDISNECSFTQKGQSELTTLYFEKPETILIDDSNYLDSQLYIALRSAVISATLGDILSGFSQTGSFASECGAFELVNGTLNMSPFCNLVNPDWVIKMAPAVCEESGYSDLLESKGSSTRQSTCLDISQNVSPGVSGYCLKEGNTWDMEGNTCPGQYSTCQAYTFNNNVTKAYNADSLVGAGLCNENNAGCLWVSTILKAGAWQDTQESRSLVSCVAAGGTWDGTRCSNSRLYINDNVEFCGNGDRGCSEVKLFRTDNNNLVQDGSFEFATPGQPHPLWKVYEVSNFTTGETCNGAISSVCSINGVTLDGVEPEFCGTCSSSGVFDQASCNDIAGATWTAGSFTQQCQTPVNTCTTDEGFCYAVTGTEPTVTKILKDGLFTAESCARQMNEGERAEFISSCPATVEARESSIGDQALLIRRDHETATSTLIPAPSVVDEFYAITYPIASSDNSTPLILSGDTYTALVSLRQQTNASTDVVVELRKTLLGGKVDSAKQIITLQNDEPQSVTLNLTTLTTGTDLSVIVHVPKSTNRNDIAIDSVKVSYRSAQSILSGSSAFPGYVEYSDNSSVFMKLPPEYLECRGYNAIAPSPRITTLRDQVSCEFASGYWDDTNTYGGGAQCYRFAPDNVECASYATMCRADEAGCQLFTPQNGDPSVPGVVGQADYCPQECVGYETFKQEPTYFEPSQISPINYFIPSTATACTVEAVGCDEFTNLSTNTGTPIEYYSFVKQCIVPNTGLGEKGFFIWQGSATGTPQLKTFLLAATPTGEPKLISSDGMCSAADVGVDLDCLEFFDDTGKSYFRKLSYTIVASNECKTLRKTVSSQSSCLATNGNWNGTQCVYSALPEESRSCSAQVSGCREYRGNTGNNGVIAFFDTFESGSANWYKVENNANVVLNTTNESVTRVGKSLLSTADTMLRNTFIENNRSYIISFWAKNSTDQTKSLGVAFENSGEPEVFAQSSDAKARVNGDWSYIELGPVFVGGGDIGNTKIKITGATNVYFDNIRLTALRDSVYVIKDTWETPASCDITNLGAPLPQAQLGCSAYADTNATVVNLKSFTKLCRESSVGCRLLFDTQNSRSPLKQIFNTSNDSDLDNVETNADALVAAVVNDASLCAPENKGCSQVGVITKTTEGTSTLASFNVKNNPDNYVNVARPILCQEQELGCVEAKNSQGEQEFIKINLTSTCTYQNKSVTKVTPLGAVTQQIAGWYKTGSIAPLGCVSSREQTANECATNGGIWNAEFGQCTSAVSGLEFNNCSAEFISTTEKSRFQDICTSEHKGNWYDNGEQGCGCARYPFEYYKAFEYPAHEVSAAVCPATYDQCTEFIEFNPNYVTNGDFEQLDNNGAVAGYEFSTTLTSLYEALSTSVSRSGTRGLELTKKTNKDLPGLTEVTDDKMSPLGLVSQRIARLDKGETYEVNYDFYVDNNTSRGQLDRYDLGRCALPQASVEVVPYLDPALVAKLTTAQKQILESTNKQSMRITQAVGGWQKSRFGIVASQVSIEIPNVANAEACAALGTTANPTNFTDGKCYASNNSESTIDYEVRLYAPLSGACVNARTGQTRYIDRNNNPFDRISCEGSVKASNTYASLRNAAITNDNFLEIIANRYGSLLAGEFVRDADDTGATPSGDAWNWVGNCTDSRVVYDKFQIAPTLDSKYYFINDGRIDKGTCNGVNWDAGCVQFEDATSGENVIIKVQPDRQCTEWLFCQARDINGSCLDWSTCSEQQGESCIRPGSLTDPLRYNTLVGGKADSITIEDYRARYGSREDLRFSRWRAGEYTGYTLPELPPLEALHDIATTPVTTEPVVADAFLISTAVNNGYGIGIDEGVNQQLVEYCKSYPEATSPYPIALKNLSQDFSGVNVLRHISEAAVDIIGGVAPYNDRYGICKYVKYTLSSVDYYYNERPTGICTAGENIGSVCTTASVIESCGTGGVCLPLKDSANPPAGITANLQSVNEKLIKGKIGVCLEEDAVLKSTGGLKDEGKQADGSDGEIGIIQNADTETNQHDTPNTCLTFFPETTLQN